MREGNFNRVERAERVEKGLGVSSQELVSGEVIAHAKSAKFAKSDVESQKSGTDFFNAEKQSSREAEKRLALAAKNAASAKPWPMVRLGDVCETISVRGHQIKQSDIRPCGFYPVVTQSENEIEGFSDEDICISDVPVVLFGDHTCIVKSLVNPFIVGADGTKLLKPKGVNFEYFVYAVKNAASKLVDGKYRRHYSDLIESSIPLPPIGVQKEIVERLEKELGEADKVAAEFKRMVELADKEFKAELDEMFNSLSANSASPREIKNDGCVGFVTRGAAEDAEKWPMVRLGDVCEFRRGLTYAKADEVAYSSKVVLRSNNVDLESGELNLNDLKYLREDFEVPVEKIIEPNTLLMCMANGSKSHLGKVALIEQDFKYAFGGFMGLLLPRNMNSKYLYYFLSDPLFKAYVKSLQDGANINNLKFSDFSEFQIPLPSIEVQKEIVAKLDAAKERCEKLKAAAERGLTAAENLRKAILSEAFEL